jgi:hypothetical protein
MAKGAVIAMDKNAENPLDPKSDNSSLNSEIDTAVENQGIVSPEDYPAAEREAQTDVVDPKKERPAAAPRAL